MLSSNVVLVVVGISVLTIILAAYVLCVGSDQSPKIWLFFDDNAYRWVKIISPRHPRVGGWPEHVQGPIATEKNADEIVTTLNRSLQDRDEWIADDADDDVGDDDDNYGDEWKRA